jgi:hypothetical protein
MKYESQPDWKMRFSASEKEYNEFMTNHGSRTIVLAMEGETHYVLVDGCPIKIEIR